MISKAATLLIFVATIASAQFMPGLLGPTPYDLSVMPDWRFNGCPPAPPLAPVICQFMQPNLGHYKPPLAPSTYMPPRIVEKCDTTHREIEMPAKKPIVIPEAPILPPITIPKFPVPEKPLPPPMPTVEPCKTAVISDATGMSIPAAPAQPPLAMPALPSSYGQHGGFMSGAGINDINMGYQSMVPHPPELPGFVMPGFPPMPLAPCPEDLPVPVVPRQPLAPIPAAPVLSPLPPMMVEQPCLTGELAVPQPVIVPQPQPMPVLPAPVLAADRCEPSIEPVMKMAEYPYFFRNSPYIPMPVMGPGIIPPHHFRPTYNVGLMPSPYVRRF